MKKIYLFILLLFQLTFIFGQTCEQKLKTVIDGFINFKSCSQRAEMNRLLGIATSVINECPVYYAEHQDEFLKAKKYVEETYDKLGCTNNGNSNTSLNNSDNQLKNGVEQISSGIQGLFEDIKNQKKINKEQKELKEKNQQNEYLANPGKEEFELAENEYYKQFVLNSRKKLPQNYNQAILLYETSSKKGFNNSNEKLFEIFQNKQLNTINYTKAVHYGQLYAENTTNQNSKYSTYYKLAQISQNDSLKNYSQSIDFYKSYLKFAIQDISKATACYLIAKTYYDRKDNFETSYLNVIEWIRNIENYGNLNNNHYLTGQANDLREKVIDLLSNIYQQGGYGIDKDLLKYEEINKLRKTNSDLSSIFKFKLTTKPEMKFNLSKFNNDNGINLVVINGSFSWCPPCKQIFKTFTELEKPIKSQFIQIQFNEDDREFDRKSTYYNNSNNTFFVDSKDFEITELNKDRTVPLIYIYKGKELKKSFIGLNNIQEVLNSIEDFNR